MNMLNHPVGIPTRYKGRQYRSRLEARWACFFDLLRWPYEYEPYDLEGWIPDFILTGHTPVLVEVKPVTTFPQEVAAKIDAVSCLTEVLIVGATLVPAWYWWDDQTGAPDGLCVGWLRQMDLIDEDTEHMGWDVAPFGQWSTAPTVGFCHAVQSFRDRISGEYDGGSYGGKECDYATIRHRWAQAGNVTQWHKEAR